MLRNRNITVGKYYVNNARKIAREVLAADDPLFVIFNTHHLDTGNSCPSPSQCTKRDFIHWADHEATPSEIASLHLRQTEAALYEPQWPRPDVMQPASTSAKARSVRRQNTLGQR